MSKKLLVAGVLMTLVVTLFAGVAVSTAGAQSMSLCQTVDALVLAGVIAPDKVAAAKAAAGCSAAVTSASFTRNLTVGSTGADVTALQTKLGVSPATGYFGAITKAAVMAYQTANGISATGFVGPLTLASLNAGVTTTTTTTTATTCPAGMTCTPVVACPAGMVCTPANAAVTTTGVEGTLSVSSTNAGLPSSIYEGDSKVNILGLKLEAKNSDISVQRVKVNLGTSANIYNKIADKIYVMDGSTVLASSDLNSDTVVKTTGTVTYDITLTGMNLVVPKGTTKTLTIALDIKSTVDTTYRGVSYTLAVNANGVRGVDGAGIDQYTSTVVSRAFSVSATLADSATLKTALNTSSPKATTVIASAGSNQDEADKVTVLVFNMKAEKDNVLVNGLTVSATGTAVSESDVTTVYLFDGATELDNTSVATSTGLAVFENVDLTIAKDTTKVLTLKVDVRTASTSALTLTASIDGDTQSTVDAENAAGDAIVDARLSGSATAETMRVQKAGAVYTLVGTPTLTKTVIGNTASSSYLASFIFDVAAEGADVSVASTSAFVVGIYSNTGTLIASSTVGYEKPTSGVTQATSGAAPYVIADGSSARFNPQMSFTAPQGVYTVGTIVSARVMSATATVNSVANTVTYISDTFRTGSQAL